MVDEIESLVAEYVAASAGMRFEAKRALWDLDESSPVLQPEEIPQALIGWPAIDDYWAGTRGSLSELHSRYRELVHWRLAPDLAVASYSLRWRATLRDSAISSPLAADTRVTLLLRRRPPGWRIFHHVESALSLRTVATRLERRAATAFSG